MAAGIDENWVIELVTDTTSDAGDFFQISMDTASGGGTAPQTDDFLINYTGHTVAGLKVYKGTGTGWSLWTGYTLGTDLVIATSVSASPKSATPHWIIELKFDKTGAIAGTSFDSNVRLAVYDASTGKTLMWPPMSQKDVPSSWGLNDYSSFNGQSIPEGLTIGVMVALSSVAVIVSTRYFRKQTKL